MFERLVCRVWGHAWRDLWTPRGGDKGAPMKVCARCGRNGWLM